MSKPPASRWATAMVALEGYFGRHPSAADSVQGIAQWWLPPSGIELPMTEVQRALEGLESRGLVERDTLPDGQVIWRLRR